jgi:hypothetical protein
VLAGLVRCTLASMDHAARRAGLEVSGAGRAHGTVSKREEDGRYAFVEIESHLDIQLEPAPEPAVARELVAKAERGCFVGNSLVARPRYRWTVNGEEIEGARRPSTSPPSAPATPRSTGRSRSSTDRAGRSALTRSSTRSRATCRSRTRTSAPRTRRAGRRTSSWCTHASTRRRSSAARRRRSPSARA